MSIDSKPWRMPRLTWFYPSQVSSVMITAVLLMSCATKPNHDYDINYDFSALKTFNQLSMVHTDDSLTADRINADIKHTLLNQGYTVQTDKPDFLVNFAFITEDKPKDSGLSIGLGTGSWGSRGGVSLGTSIGIPLGSDSAKTQIIQIDIIEPDPQRLIWRGSGQYHFDQGGENKANNIQATVEKILAQFPPNKQP
jgi:hypothetical protein